MVKRKLFPLVAPAMAAGALFLAGLLGEALGEELKQFFAPILPHWKWLMGGGLAVTILSALWDRWHADAPDDTSAPQRNVTMRDATASTIITGDGNQVQQVKGDAVSGDKLEIHLHPTPEIRPPSVVANALPLRQPKADFTGREDILQKIRTERGGNVAIVAGVQGMGGVGKTELALQLADEWKADYPDAQLMIDLHGYDRDFVTTERALEMVIRAFHPEAGQLPATVAELQSVYHSVWQEQVKAGKRMVLLLDNARDHAHIEPLLPPREVLLLITSRTHLTLPQMKSYDLEKMPPEDAKLLLVRLCQRLGEPTAAEALNVIAEQCDGLPLALRVAGEHLQVHRDVAPDRYAQRLRSERLKHLSAVAATLSLSYEMLSPDQQAHWRQLAVFPAPFDLYAAAAVLSLNEDDAQDALTELFTISLLEFDDAAPRYCWHDLACEFALAQSNDNERHIAALRNAQHFRVLLEKAEDLFLKGGNALLEGLQLFDQERSHIEHSQRWATSHQAADKEIAELSFQYTDKSLHILHFRLNSFEWMRWVGDQLNAARHLNNRDTEGTALNNLGNLFFDLRDWHKALECYEESIAIYRELNNLPKLEITLSNLGGAFLRSGDQVKAIQCYEEAFAICRKEGNRARDESHLTDLGHYYFETGDTQKALEFYQKALLSCREVGNQKGEFSAWRNIANAYKDYGDSYNAVICYELALKLSREIGDSEIENIALVELGHFYAEHGGARKAIECYEEAILYERKTRNRRGEAICLWSISLCLEDLGERSKAIENAETSLHIREAIGDPNADMVRQKLEEWRQQ